MRVAKRNAHTRALENNAGRQGQDAAPDMPDVGGGIAVPRHRLNFVKGFDKHFIFGSDDLGTMAAHCREKGFAEDTISALFQGASVAAEGGGSYYLVSRKADGGAA